MFASNISPAATFRVIEAKSPTLLIDEADAFFRENEELRGVINSGHTRATAYVIRTVGDDHEVKQFSTWGAKAIALIGKLPDTVMDRAIVLPLRRKGPSEKVERLRHAGRGLFDALARKLARFGADHGVEIGRARPALPDALNDRAQDNWEPLLAVADLAGGSWPKQARRAALALSGAGEADLSIGEQLLSAIRDVFEENPFKDKISREELLKRLIEDEEQPWASWNKGRPLSAAQLRTKLKPYGITTKKVRINSYETAQGFEHIQFEDAWARYLDGETPSSPSPPPPQDWNIGTSEENHGFERSNPVPFSNPEWNMEQNPTDVPENGPVPFQKPEWNTNGTLNVPENGLCSNVPIPDPPSGRDEALDEREVPL